MPAIPSSSPYGWTKVMIERILTDYVTAHPDFCAILLRYFNPIGAHESGLLGDDPNGIPNNLMPYIGRVAAGQLEKLTIFGGDYPTPDGTCQRDYLHVVDLAVGHLKALEYAASHTGVEAINLGTGHGISVLELVHAFETANQIKLPYEIAPRLNPHGLILLCPGAGMWFGCAQRADAVVEKGQDWFDMEGLKYKMAFNYDMARHPAPFEEAKGYTGPVLIVRASDDKLVDEQTCQSYAQCYDRPELVTTEGGGHNFAAIPVRKAVTDSMIAFIQKHF